ncbi:MAG: adenylate/guanylate cyclase domain-containing protein [Desulfobacteraceae bacterium]|nr:adenylate/guanylate cyclase domain-containing protein [Desulfobacteraceae bacterium]
MGGIVFRNHGIIDKYLGDGFLAVFGAPVSGTQDADNAIFAALEMKSAVEHISSYCLGEFGERVRMGISIHTGETVVGNIGFDMKMDYTVIGDPVNSVFRLQNVAKNFPNGILIGEQTCRASLSHLRIREVGENLVRDIEPRLGGVQSIRAIGDRR